MNSFEDETQLIGRPKNIGDCPPQLGAYRIIRRLGGGGMGDIYLAEQTSVGRQVAIKVLPRGLLGDAQMLARFNREIHLLAQLSHPHICPVHEAGVEGDTHYYAMEYLPGLDLSGVLETERMDARRAAEIACQIGRALQYAHEQNVIHRDVKPKNLVLVRGERKRRGSTLELEFDDHAYLIDFGLARGTETTKLTVAGQIMGTPSYMAPEQAAADESRIGPATDIYSLGATLYEMLILRPPFVGASMAAVVHQVIHDDPVPIRRVNPRIDRALETIVRKAMESEPSRRYATAGAFADDLERWLTGEVIQAQPASLAYRLRKKMARNKPVTCLLALLIALALGWGGWRGAESEKRSRKRARDHAAAAQALSEGRWRDAIRQADVVLRLFPDDFALRSLKGRARAEIYLVEARGKQARRDELSQGIRRVQAELAALIETRDQARSGQRRAAWLAPSGKRSVWEVEDQLVQLRLRREMADIQAEQSATEALRFDAKHAGVSEFLAALYLNRWQRARKERNADKMRLWADLVARFDTGTYRAKMWHELKLSSSPADASAHLFVYRQIGRRMIPVPLSRTGEQGEVSPTKIDPLPLSASPGRKGRARRGYAYALRRDAFNRVSFPLKLPAGAYLVLFSRPGCLDTRYAVLLRGGGTFEATVSLVAEAAVPEQFVYIPAGSYVTHYDPAALDCTRQKRQSRKVTLPGFAISRFSVQCGEYLDFLNDRSAHTLDAAFRRAPRKSKLAGHLWKKQNGRIVSGKVPLDWPVFAISWNDAKAYARWYTRKHGAGKWTFDLPSEPQWELAAGAGLGWLYPWGDRFEQGFCRTKGARGPRDQPEPVGLFPADESPYGVRDMGGLILTWTRTPTRGPNKEIYRIVKGGTWRFPPSWSRICLRSAQIPPDVPDIVTGVRLVASIKSDQAKED